MANEITASLQLSCINSNFNPGQINVTKQIDQAAAGANAGVQICSTSIETVPVGDLSTYGLLYMRNLDSTNFITYGSTLLLEFKLKPGEFCLMRVTPAATIGIKANAASCKVQQLWLED